MISTLQESGKGKGKVIKGTSVLTVIYIELHGKEKERGGGRRNMQAFVGRIRKRGKNEKKGRGECVRGHVHALIKPVLWSIRLVALLLSFRLLRLVALQCNVFESMDGVARVHWAGHGVHVQCTCFPFLTRSSRQSTQCHLEKRRKETEQQTTYRRICLIVSIANPIDKRLLNFALLFR